MLCAFRVHVLAATEIFARSLAWLGQDKEQGEGYDEEEGHHDVDEQ